LQKREDLDAVAEMMVSKELKISRSNGRKENNVFPMIPTEHQCQTFVLF
jgi:hypothetical protein